MVISIKVLRPSTMGGVLAILLHSCEKIGLEQVWDSKTYAKERRRKEKGRKDEG